MRINAECALCGHSYNYPEGIDEKAVMRCPNCNEFITITTGRALGSTPAVADTPKPQARETKQAALPPLKRQNTPNDEVRETTPAPLHTGDYPSPVETASEVMPKGKPRQQDRIASYPAVSGSIPELIIWVGAVAFAVAIFANFPPENLPTNDPVYLHSSLLMCLFGTASALLVGLALTIRALR